MRHVLGLVLLPFALALVTAAAPPPDLSGRLARLIARLGDTDRAVRQQAERDLVASGAPALPALREAGRTHADADVRLRAFVAARAIERRLAGEERTFAGHQAGISSVAVSPDGRLLASGAEQAGVDHTIRLWDVATGKPGHVLRGHTGPVRAVAFHPDGKRLLSGGRDGTLRLWDVATGKPLGAPVRDAGIVSSVAFSDDGKRIASSTLEAYTIRVWGPELDGRLRDCAGHPGGVTNQVAFVPGTHRFVSGSKGTVGLWDADTGDRLRTFNAGTAVGCVAVSADGKRVVAANNNNSMLIWDLGTGAPVAVCQGHTSLVAGVAILPDGSRVLSAGLDKSVRLWDGETGKLLRVFPGHDEAALCAAFLPGGRQAITGGTDRVLRLWNVR